MGTITEDIKSQSAWIVKAFNADGLKLDYSIDSFKNLDKFFDLNSVNGKAKKGSRLASNLGPIIFSIGGYVGETFIKTFPGSVWVVDENDPEVEMNVEIKLPDGAIIWPVQRVMKRFKNGAEDGLFVYGFLLAKENGIDINSGVVEAKPWWKLW